MSVEMYFASYGNNVIHEQFVAYDTNYMNPKHEIMTNNSNLICQEYVLCHNQCRVLRESFPRQVDKKSRGLQGERGLEFSRRKKGQNFFPSLQSLGLYNNNVLCLRTVSGLNLLAYSVKLWEQTCSLQGLYNNNVFCLRTVSGLNLLANSVILKCKLWEQVW